MVTERNDQESIVERIVEKLEPHRETFMQWRFDPVQLRSLVRLFIDYYSMNPEALNASIEKTKTIPETYRLNCLVRDAVKEVIAED